MISDIRTGILGGMTKKEVFMCVLIFVIIGIVGLPRCRNIHGNCSKFDLTVPYLDLTDHTQFPAPITKLWPYVI